MRILCRINGVLMRLSRADFFKRYQDAAKRLGFPAPNPAVLESDYRAYLYGESLLLRSSSVRFFRDDAGELNWEIRQGGARKTVGADS